MMWMPSMSSLVILSQKQYIHPPSSPKAVCNYSNIWCRYALRYVFFSYKTLVAVLPKVKLSIVFFYATSSKAF
jgi:hypothetical protein